MLRMLLLVGCWVALTAADPVAIGGPRLRELTSGQRSWHGNQASQVSWPAGRRTMAEAVALLAAGGQSIQATGDTASQDMPAFSGTWWQGVADVCDRFGLRLLPAPVVGEGDGIAITGGPVELTVAPPVLWRPAGAVAVTATPGVRAGKDNGIRLAIRLEPGLGIDGIWSVSAASTDQATTTVRVVFTEPFAAVVPIKPDDSLALDLGGLAGEVSLKQQGALWQLRTALPAERLPSGQTPMLFAVRMDADGQALRNRSASFSTQTVDGVTRLIRVLRYADLGDAALRVTVSGQALLGEAAFTIPPPPTAATADPRAVATTVAWPAGRRSLADAMALLNVTGNTVVTELGVDARTEADLPACQGSWWEGVLAVARAYGLTVLPPPVPEADDATLPVSCAAVCLGRPGAGRPALDDLQLCGAALVQAGLAAGEPATISALIRLEPRMAAIDASEIHVTWERTADLSGKSLAVTDPGAEGKQNQRQGFQMVRIGRRFVASSVSAAAGDRPVATCQVTLPAEAAGVLKLGATITIASEHPVHADLPVAIGAAQVVRLGDLALLAQVVESAANPELGLPAGTWLTLAGLGADDASVLAGPPGGQQAACDGPVPLRNRRPQRLAWSLPGAGPWQVSISAIGAGIPLTVPLAISVPVPGR